MTRAIEQSISRRVLVFSKETGGGTGAVLSNIARLAKEGLEISFYFYKKDKLSYFKGKAHYVSKNYPTSDFPSLFKGLYFIQNLLNSYSLIKNLKPHLVFTSDYYSSLLLGIIRPLFPGTSFINSVHINLVSYIADKPSFLYRQVLNRLTSYLLNTYDVNVFVSKGLQGSVVKNFKIRTKTEVIYNGIDIKNIQKLLQEPLKDNFQKLLKKKGFNIISVGRLSKQKDYPTLFKAYSLFLKKHSDSQLFIVSDGEIKNDLIKLAKRLGIEKNTHFLGWVENFYPLLSRCDLFVFASSYEGFGITIVEALAAGTPVISTNTPYGPSEILENGKFGEIVPSGNVKELALSMEKLLKNPGLRHKFSGLGIKRSRFFDVSEMLESYSKLFTHLPKLLVVVKSIDGGTGTFLVNFLKISKLGINLKILALERPQFRKDFPESIHFLRKAKFYPDSYNLSLGNAVNFIEETAWLKENIDQYEPDITLGIDVHANLLLQVNKLLFFRKLKTVLTTHIDVGQTLSQKGTPLVSTLIKKAVSFFYKRANSIICVSKGVSKHMHQVFGIKSRTIYNGANFTPPGEERKNPSGRVITIARLVEQKDHETLIKAFARVLKAYPKAKLTVLSWGPLGKQLEQFVVKLGLTKSIKFLGWVKNISGYLSKSDIFVLSSKREGFNYAIIEAMAQGLPVVSTNTPYGPSEILDNGKYGILVPLGDHISLSRAILRLLTNDKNYQYYSKKAGERAQYFSLDKMLKGYKNILSQVLNEKNLS